VSKRAGRVFFDAGMNARVKTLSAPYSVRGVPGAPVAMPLEWDALAGASPLDYTIATAPVALAARGDVWSRVLRKKQDLAEVIRGGL
jgi:bifunctional non-homologous end joining protein LigD